MVNFGIIFFVSIGAITVGILTAPEDLHGYGWGVLPATIVGIVLAGIFGWALAYPTARLRTDYFAIVTISLGEIVRGPPRRRASSQGRVNWPWNRYCRIPLAIGELVVLRAE